MTLLVFKNKKVQETICFFANHDSPPRGLLWKVLCTIHCCDQQQREEAQWLNRYPGHIIHNLRGNVNTRLKKNYRKKDWDAAIFAQAEFRKNRPSARPQALLSNGCCLRCPGGAIVVVCRENDRLSFNACQRFNRR